jgi:hypothetical protein
MKSKSAIFLVALSLSGLLIGCHKTAINQVRTGYMEFNKTTTLGQAIDHSFQNGKWTSFTTPKGATIVEFDGSAPLSAFSNGPLSCQPNVICMALLKKFTADCEANDPIVAKLRQVNLELNDIRHQQDVLDSRWMNEPGFQEKIGLGEFNRQQDELRATADKLQNYLIQTHPSTDSCVNSVISQHLSDPIPVTIQFTINNDGTFQYEADNASATNEQLFTFIYK